MFVTSMSRFAQRSSAQLCISFNGDEQDLAAHRGFLVDIRIQPSVFLPSTRQLLGCA
jgi:hypothetical protein